MQPYLVTLPDGVKAFIVQKTSGRKHSINLLLFKIKRSNTLIAYSVRVQELETADYVLYKVRKSGSWKQGGERNQRRLTIGGHKRMQQIKNAIDNFENTYGKSAYKDLF